VKVTDFGIARITDSSKTKTGLVLGTPSFMSPEQIAGKKVDGRSDLYSLGVMLFQMLAGVLPFRGDSMAELMYKIANEEAADIRIIRKDLSERIAQIVAHSLSKKPETRYQDGDAFAADLREAIAEMSGGATAPMKIIPPRMPAPAQAAAAPAAATAAADKTVAYRPEAPPAPSTTQYEATQPAAPAAAYAATAPAGNPAYAATVPSGAPGFGATVPAGPGQASFAATVPASAMPGYDALRKDPAAPAPAQQFEKTAVMKQPVAPEVPKAAGKTGQEP